MAMMSNSEGYLADIAKKIAEVMAVAVTPGHVRGALFDVFKATSIGRLEGFPAGRPIAGHPGSTYVRIRLL